MVVSGKRGGKEGSGRGVEEEVEVVEAAEEEVEGKIPVTVELVLEITCTGCTVTGGGIAFNLFFMYRILNLCFFWLGYCCFTSLSVLDRQLLQM